MKESPRYTFWPRTKAKLAICIIAACLDLPVYMVLVSKRLLPSGHSVPRSFSIRGYCTQLFQNTPLRPASYRRNYTTLWVHGPQVFHKSTETDIQKAILFFIGAAKIRWCWNILWPVGISWEWSRAPGEATLLSWPPWIWIYTLLSTTCWATEEGLFNTFKKFCMC